MDSSYRKEQGPFGLITDPVRHIYGFFIAESESVYPCRECSPSPAI